jgi:hypothetical protein
MTKFGIDQTSKIPPIWWRRLERSIMIGLAPAIILLANKIIQDPQVLASVTSYVGFGLGIVKTIGIFLGSELDYSQSLPPESDPVDDLHIEKE